MSETEARRQIKAVLDKLEPWKASRICQQFAREYGIRALGYTAEGRPGRARG